MDNLDLKMSEYIIRDYVEGDLPALVTHWKESVRGWPPGFNPIADWTEENVSDWLLRKRFIATWLGVLDGTIVAYLRYTKYWGDPEVEMVDIFNAHPDFHGNSYGRKLLVHAVDRAVADKAKRLDLYTWAGNRKAVPLYKKCGFFWRPNISWTHMYNFLPVVLNNPLVKEFLDGTHWYDSMRQPLEVKEDDEKIDGCSYHRYTFEKDGKKLVVHVDPSTSGITGIISDDLTIRCDLPGEAHIAGFPSPVRWAFKPGEKKGAIVRMKCEESEGLQYTFNEKFELRAARVFKTFVTPDRDVRPEPVDWYSKPLVCKVAVDDTEFEMKPGVRALRPFKIDTRPHPLFLTPGERRAVTFNLISRIQSSAVFRPSVRAKGGVSLVESFDNAPVAISSEESFGFRLEIEATEAPGSGSIEIGGELLIGKDRSSIAPIEVHARIESKGRPIEVSEDDPELKTISNGRLSITAARRAGSVKVHEFETGRELLSIRSEEIGDPISMEFNSKNYDIQAEIGDLRAELVCRAESDSFPGIVIERRISLGSAVDLAVGISVINEGDRPFTGRVMLRMNTPVMSGIYAPIGSHVVGCSSEGWYGQNSPLPNDPSVYSEPWVAWVGPQTRASENRITGVVFRGASKVKWSRYPAWSLEYTVDNLRPGEKTTFPAVELVLKASSWQEVQRKALDGEPSKLTACPLDIVHCEHPLVAGPGPTTLTFNRMMAQPAEGRVRVELPDGKIIEAVNDKWSIESPISVEVPEFPENDRGVKKVPCKVVREHVEREMEIPLVVPIRGKSVTITGVQDGGMDVLVVRNGSIEFRVAPGFHGVLYRLSEESNPEINLLRTSYPDPGMWTWMNPWYGGIGCFPDLEYRTHHSGFRGEPVRMEWGDHSWEGVRVEMTPLRQWSSLGIEFLYLTLPGVPIVLHLMRFREKRNCRRDLFVETRCFPAPSGDPTAPTEVLTDEWGSQVRLDRTTTATEIGLSDWGAVYDPLSRKTVGAVAGRGGFVVFDASESGMVLWGGNEINASSQHTCELPMLYVVCENPELVRPMAGWIRMYDRAVAMSDPEPRMLDGGLSSDFAPVRS